MKPDLFGMCSRYCKKALYLNKYSAKTKKSSKAYACAKSPILKKNMKKSIVKKWQLKLRGQYKPSASVKKRSAARTCAALLYTVVITSNCPSLCEIHIEPFKTLQNQNFHIPPLTPRSQKIRDIRKSG